MSVHSALYEIVVRDFTKAFGEPRRCGAEHCNWSLRRFSYVGAVNVLVTTGTRDTMVWVFDPHDPANGAQYHLMTDEAQIGKLVTEILGRVSRAGRPHAAT